MSNTLSKLSVRLLFKGIKVVTIESCTGGFIGKTLTDLAGSSDWFEAGFITYSNEAKVALVNVPEETISKYGAVSEEVADAMAVGALKIFPECLSISVTGIAGPGGGSRDKPVGTVCIGCAYKNAIKVRRYHFAGSREEVRKETVKQALDIMLSMDVLK